MTITVGTSMQVQANGSGGSFSCVGSGTDADDGTFTLGKCSDGVTGRTVTYVPSTDQVRLTTTTCEFCRSVTITFNRK
jgi:hypothetical protein